MPLRKLTQSATKIILKGRDLCALSEDTIRLGDFLELLKDHSEFGLTELVQDVFSDVSWEDKEISLKELLESSFDEARKMGSTYVGTEHLFLGLIRRINPDKLEAVRKKISDLSGLPSIVAQKKATSSTPLLDSFGENLVRKAKRGNLNPFYGRDFVLERLNQTLLRREKSSPVLIGESGVGKTALVQHLSKKISSGEVPPQLIEKKVIRLKLSRLFGAFGPRKGVEAGFSGVLEEVVSAGNVILFIDEMHQLMGRSFLVESSSPLIELLKDVLEEENFQFIGATTDDDYTRFLEFDQGLLRRIEPILVPEPVDEELENILRAAAPRFEKFHHIKYANSVYREVIRLADRYIPQGNFPDKAIEILDDLGAKLRINNVSNNDFESVRKSLNSLEKELEEKMKFSRWGDALRIREQRDSLKKDLKELEAESEVYLPAGPELVASIVSQKTGIPLNKVGEGERERLEKLEDVLSRYVIGQDHAVRALCRTLRRSRVGLADTARPIGSFLFLGPTGVGKTELARKLVEVLFEDGDLIRFDMSEFRERHTASRLIGAPPGYVGYGHGGELTERVRRNPYSVVLFDEMEKAHPEVLNLLLQIMEEGELRDGRGRVTDFTNTIIILTSNVGAELVSKGHLGFDLEDSLESEYKRVKNNLLENLKTQVRPEFLNRLNDVLVFRSLALQDVEKIVELRLSELKEQLAELELELEVTFAAKNLLAEQGYSKEYGARPLTRVIENSIEVPLSEKMLSGGVKEGDLIKVRVRKGAIEICPQ